MATSKNKNASQSTSTGTSPNSSRGAKTSTQNLDESDITTGGPGGQANQDIQSQTPRKGASTTGDTVRRGQPSNGRNDTSDESSEDSLQPERDMSRSGRDL